MKRWGLCQTYETVVNWLLEAMEVFRGEDRRICEAGTEDGEVVTDGIGEILRFY